MNKRGGKALWISVILVILLVIIAFFYFALYSPRNEEKYSTRTIVNPTEGLTDEQAVAQFDESFVFYLLYSIKAYNLRNPPLSSNTPKMEVLVDDQVYKAVVEKGIITIGKGEMEMEDIVIKTSKYEAVKMIRDVNYVQTSFRNGGSGIELMASKSELFAKGYLNIYNELTGESVTGSVVRIYTD